ncbi:YwpF family protein [Bacillus sp. REN10]|uniref:YwpF family protein n=1 Tax=Bacillus sp. REN10 TaxID=2782541 RepID=UPI00193B4D43|nr:YwpF family protein [Bacillus sp. REN10]
MKTFKIAGFFLNKDEQLQEITLIDGLIINKEDDKRTWLIELFVNKDDESFFLDCQKREGDMNVQILISHRNNDPAVFLAEMRDMKMLDGGISILLEGRLQQMRNEYAKQVLESLIHKGVEGNDLIEAFNQSLQRRRNIPTISEKK